MAIDKEPTDTQLEDFKKIVKVISFAMNKSIFFISHFTISTCRT